MQWCSGTFEMVARTLSGLERVLAKEIRDLGIEDTRIVTRAVKFKGQIHDLYKLNIHLRTALNILIPIDFLSVNDDGQYYFQLNNIAWEDIFQAGNTFKISTSGSGRNLKHTRFLTQRAKDAIVDRLKDKAGFRPAVHVNKPNIKVHLHFSHNEESRQDTVQVSLNASGEDLNKRGYSANSSFAAPLNECLAAGLILHTKWKGTQPLFDPMCGSGTILIEAAMIAKQMAPNIERKFGFQVWDNYDAGLFHKIQTEAKEQIIECPVKISGSDIAAESIQAAIEKVTEAGLEDEIYLKRQAFERIEKKEERGVMVVNPPYYERLETPVSPTSFYKKFGSVLLEQLPQYECWLFSSNKEAMFAVPMKPVKTYHFLNGNLECLFRQYHPWKGMLEEGYVERAAYIKEGVYSDKNRKTAFNRVDSKKEEELQKGRAEKRDSRVEKPKRKEEDRKPRQDERKPLASETRKPRVVMRPRRKRKDED